MFCFVRTYYAFIEAAAFLSIVLRYAGATMVTRVSFFFHFVYLEMSLFPIIFCTIIAVFSLNGEHVVDTPSSERTSRVLGKNDV